MTVASGKILGSTNERIQSYPSDQIYNDYFIQLYQYSGLKIGNDYQIYSKISGEYGEKNDNAKQVGTRVRIKDYDSYLGHIYPQIGQDGFTPEQIEQSNIFRVFKMSNNPDNISTKDKVDFCITDKYFVPKWFDDSSSNPSASSLKQVFIIKNVTGSSSSETLEKVKNVYNKPFFMNTSENYN